MAIYRGERINSVEQSEEEFHQLYNQELQCPSCLDIVFPRVGPLPYRTAHFYHRRKSACLLSSSAISKEHLYAQAVIEAAIGMVYGWAGRSEWSGDGFRADVMAEHRGVPMHTFEVQRSPMTGAQAKERVRRHKQGNIKQTTWLNMRGYTWSSLFPSALLNVGKIGGPISVTYKILPRSASKTGTSLTTVPIVDFIRQILTSELEACYEEQLIAYDEYGTPGKIKGEWIFESQEQIREGESKKRMAILSLQAKTTRVPSEARHEMIKTLRQLYPTLGIISGEADYGYGAIVPFDDKLIVVQPSLMDIESTPILFQSTTRIIYSTEAEKLTANKQCGDKRKAFTLQEVVSAGGLAAVL